MKYKFIKGIVAVVLSAVMMAGAAFTGNEAKQTTALTEKSVATESQTEVVIPEPSEVTTDQNLGNSEAKNPVNKIEKLDTKNTVAKRSSEKTEKQGAKKDEVNKVAEKRESQKQTHTHTWEPVYEDVVYEEVHTYVREICHGCGADITDWSRDKWQAHSSAHMDKGEPSGFAEREFQKTVPVTVKKKVGYRCSCGATK